MRFCNPWTGIGYRRQARAATPANGESNTNGNAGSVNCVFDCGGGGAGLAEGGTATVARVYRERRVERVARLETTRMVLDGELLVLA